MPSYFPLVGRVKVRAGDTVRLKATHSELNIMFEVLGVDAKPAEQDEGKVEEEMASEVVDNSSGTYVLSPANAFLASCQQPGSSTRANYCQSRNFVIRWVGRSCGLWRPDYGDSRTEKGSWSFGCRSAQRELSGNHEAHRTNMLT